MTETEDLPSSRRADDGTTKVPNGAERYRSGYQVL